MYVLDNPKPKFVPYDVVKIKKTGELALIREVNQNTSQVEDQHQWSFAISLFDKSSTSHVAWYAMDELELVNNIFEIIAKNSVNSNSSSGYKFRFRKLRRK